MNRTSRRRVLSATTGPSGASGSEESASSDSGLPTRDEVVARLRAAGCVWAEDEADVLLEAADSASRLELFVERRVAGEPLELVVGWARFGGLRITVAPGVFVPRRRSEFLVSVASDVASADPVVVDVGCGTGALGAALVARVAGSLYATDVDPVAVACARRNVPIGASVYCGDLFSALPLTLRGRVDVLLANAPYVPSEEIALLPAEARSWEPRVALDGGVDGLDVHRRIAAGAASWLAADGTLLIEVSERQRPAATALLETAGLLVVAHSDDTLGALVLAATRRPSA